MNRFGTFLYVCAVNSVLRTITAGLLACTYLLASFIPAHVEAAPQHIYTSDKQNACFAESSVNFQNSALRSENVFSNLTIAYTSDFKNASKDSGLIQHFFENLTNAAFRFHIGSPVNSLFRFYLTDIIFPFHFFR